VRSSIRTQILLPFCATLLASVAIIAATSAWLAVRRAEQQTLLQIRGVVDTLVASRLTYTKPILDKMHGLSGAEFVAVDQAGQVIAATLAEAAQAVEQGRAAPLISAGSSLSELPTIDAGRRYFAARIRADGAARVSELLVLYPESSWQEARRSAIWPPLVVGAVTVIVMAAISAWLAARIGQRVGTVQELLAAIADGRFPESPNADESEPRDELDDLVASAGRLSDQLQELQQTIRDTERVRLLAQLAGGLAHQLRNAVTGARMAVQLHRKSCDRSEDESLDVALRQLELTEQHIRGLLSLSRREQSPAQPGDVGDIVNEIKQLIDPQCRHAHVQLTVTASAVQGTAVPDAEALRGSLLNLALNAIEAAGADGRVEILADITDRDVIIEVRDTGAGPPRQVCDSLFDPFVTSKPEGVGLGLALARKSIEGLDGSLIWERCGDLTVFRITLPVGAQTTDRVVKPVEQPPRLSATRD
jgi:signal transduction histidine kinase